MSVQKLRPYLAPLALAVSGCICILLLQIQFTGFVLDDSFITYRYAENLANGHGFVWNIGDDPVEGFTSFLWVITNAVAIKCYIDPLLLSRIMSTIASFIIILMLSFKTRNAPLWLSIVIVAGVSLNPAIAFLSMQGMETLLTALLALILSAVSMKLVDKWSLRIGILWHILAFLSMLSRPDMAPISAGIFIGITGVYIYSKRFTELRNLLISVIIPVMMGIIYMYWRIDYFGYLFPNPFYLKTSFNGTFLPGLTYVYQFILLLVLPYIIIGALALLTKPISKADILKITPPFLGTLAFLSFLLFVYPIQGLLWRFAMPVFPVILYSIAIPIRQFSFLKKKSYIQKSVSIILILLFILWPLRHNNLARFEMKRRTQHDRVLVGKSLFGLSGTMFVSDSGALPYYSKWRSLDNFGLTSETIVHEGLTVDLLKSTNPDLIMLSLSNQPDRFKDYPVAVKYIENSDFVATVAIEKNSKRSHLYLVRRSSALFNEILNRLTKLEGANYTDTKKVIGKNTQIKCLDSSNIDSSKSTSGPLPNASG